MWFLDLIFLFQIKDLRSDDEESEDDFESDEIENNGVNGVKNIKTKDHLKDGVTNSKSKKL